MGRGRSTRPGVRRARGHRRGRTPPFAARDSPCQSTATGPSIRGAGLTSNAARPTTATTLCPTPSPASASQVNATEAPDWAANVRRSMSQFHSRAGTHRRESVPFHLRGGTHRRGPRAAPRRWRRTPRSRSTCERHESRAANGGGGPSVRGVPPGNGSVRGRAGAESRVPPREWKPARRAGAVDSPSIRGAGLGVPPREWKPGKGRAGRGTHRRQSTANAVARPSPPAPAATGASSGPGPPFAARDSAAAARAARAAARRRRAGGVPGRGGPIPAARDSGTPALHGGQLGQLWRPAGPIELGLLLRETRPINPLFYYQKAESFLLSLPKSLPK